jgi:N-methylhydantoinase A
MSHILAGCEETGLDCPAYVMQSNGGVMSVDEAAENAHRMVLSGPAGGVLAATKVAERTEFKNLITFDMGGTSTDIALIADGKAAPVRQSIFHHKPLMVPQFDIHTIGSGGGSIAWVSDSGLLRVGPQSAGAVPGPACYGRGGTLPTTTDAHVVLGRVHPDHFLGGEMTLDHDAAVRAVTEHVAKPLGVSLEEAAIGMLEVSNTLMSKGVRVVSVNRGFDPKDFMLLPFGGAGGMHAADVARIVGAAGVLVPQHPGIFSALGMAAADLKYDYSQIVDAAIDTVDLDSLNETFARLIQRSEDRVGPAGAESVSHQRMARLQYAWQNNDLMLPLPDEEMTAEGLERLVEEFHQRHQFEFGHSDPEGTVELLAVGIETTGHLRAVELAHSDEVQAYEPEVRARRNVYFADAGWLDTPLYERSDLRAGAHFDGPAIIEEREATTVVPPGSEVRVDGDYNIEISFV